MKPEIRQRDRKVFVIPFTVTEKIHFTIFTFSSVRLLNGFRIIPIAVFVLKMTPQVVQLKY